MGEPRVTGQKGTEPVSPEETGEVKKGAKGAGKKQQAGVKEDTGPAKEAAVKLKELTKSFPASILGVTNSTTPIIPYSLTTPAGICNAVLVPSRADEAVNRAVMAQGYRPVILPPQIQQKLDKDGYRMFVSADDFPVFKQARMMDSGNWFYRPKEEPLRPGPEE